MEIKLYTVSTWVSVSRASHLDAARGNPAVSQDKQVHKPPAWEP